MAPSDSKKGSKGGRRKGPPKKNEPNKQEDQQQNQNNNKSKSKKKKENGQKPISSTKSNNKEAKSSRYVPHWSWEDCIQTYADGKLVRGTLRVLPHSPSTAASSRSFVTCDRGLHAQDICLETEVDRNRAMDGDVVFVELVVGSSSSSTADDDNNKTTTAAAIATADPPTRGVQNGIQNMTLQETGDDEAGDVIHSVVASGMQEDAEETKQRAMWQDDAVQMDLWNPVVPIPMPRRRKASTTATSTTTQEDRRRLKEQKEQAQLRGRVVHIVPPKAVHSEMNPSQSQSRPTRRIVGALKVLNDNTILLTPNNRSLPQFKCPVGSTRKLLAEQQEETKTNEEQEPEETKRYYYQAEYEYGSWQESHKWPPCMRLKVLGEACVLEDEIQALLTEHDVDHGDHSPEVLRNVDEAVQSGVYLDSDHNLGWKPTPAMYKGRRDYRSERIFTIDPTTAKDLDDALHIKELPDGTIELGVHIADVSYFVKPDTPVDVEAARRATTVYLVDRTVPMLPRPLCEVACSLNENVERLAFSCVWKMRPNGTMVKQGKSQEDCVWYGRSVIKSCARLDYATAQNIIEKKVANGEDENELDEALWPKSRRPSGPHSIQQVAADVRLMHRVAMARRRLRFQNGALALHGIKLTFQLDTDGQTPLLTAPYPIRDSNRLVEEYMLLANYLVAQRLITHAGDLAVLRNHGEPEMDKLDDLVAVVKAATGFQMDVSSSQTLHTSLVQLERDFGNDPLLLKCITQLMMTPMVPADYFAAGERQLEEYHHFALNIPFYTHFTSPIRRYPDVLVHRLLQATIDGTIPGLGMDSKQIQRDCEHCNDKRMKSKKAQERCDRVYLSLYVKAHPIKSQLGVVLSVGKTSFTVFVPSLGVNALLYLQEHQDVLTYASEEQRDGTRRILMQQKANSAGEIQWGTLEIVLLTKLLVTLTCRDEPPVDVKLRFEGPWRE